MPMYYETRKLEKNPYFVDYVKNVCGYQDFIDLSYFEKENKALEGRGIIIFDHKDCTFYIGETNRAHVDVIEEFLRILNTKSVNR